MDDRSSESWSTLVIADDVHMQGHLRGMLRDADMAPSAVQSAQDGISILGKHHFDLILVDAGIPDVTMQILCEAARSLYGHSCIIIAVANKQQQWLRIQSLYLGADDCVNRDCHGSELFARMYARMRRRIVLTV